jgi:Protein kinase domain
MSRNGEEHPADRLANTLAAYDDLLIAGKHTPPAELEQAVDPALLADWNRLTAFLMLVDQAWPRTNEDDPSATEPTPASSAMTAAGPAEPASENQRRFGRFQILRTLGQGGFGIVFLAWDPALRRQVALKVPQPVTLMTPEARKRFEREAHAAAGLHHPNIVPVYETGSVGSVSYIAAAYCPGPTLDGWLSRQIQPTPARDAARLIATLARAVAHAHERGVLHRDLKPSNILLERTAANDLAHGENEPLGVFEPRITDFSLAKLVDGLGPETRSGFPFGSPPYMAPEQAEGKLKTIGPPTDVYGLGCILYELLTGRPPFRDEGQLETLRQVIADEPLPPRRRRRELSPDLEAIVLYCLEKDVARRYPSAQALAEDLDRFLADRPTLARPAGVMTGAWRWLLRPQRIREAGMIAIIYAFITILWLVCAATLVRLGIVFHLQRPAEFYRDALIVTFGDFVPALWLGWWIREGRLWAIWAGLVTAIVRLCLMSGGLFGLPPRFGDFYGNEMMRMAIYVAIINMAVILFVSNLVALLAYHANKDLIRYESSPAG